ncbi:hypothetical protein M413DRAFT_260795 [Hebeloma cylindrosporum]|uniref:Uncharacterized protein n=1 Tax=Hebeloma cylindrosporum TaxID=76867 RepID=A0A0C3CS40_HEBCY|nr:hypothetical protein M413DRAFT_260795 [Hebeloma cylindrosporum h7]
MVLFQLQQLHPDQRLVQWLHPAQRLVRQLLSLRRGPGDVFQSVYHNFLVAGEGGRGHRHRQRDGVFTKGRGVFLRFFFCCGTCFLIPTPSLFWTNFGLIG